MTAGPNARCHGYRMLRGSALAGIILGAAWAPGVFSAPTNEVAARARVQLDRLLQRAPQMAKQEKAATSAIDELQLRQASQEMIAFHRRRAADLTSDRRRLDADIAYWTAVAAGDADATRKPDGDPRLDAPYQGYADLLRRRASGSTNGLAQAEKAFSNAVQKLTADEAARHQPVLDLYGRVQALAAGLDMVEHGRSRVRQRVLEDRMATLARAIYHIRNLQGGHIPNAQFDEQFASLYGRIVKTDAPGDDPAMRLDTALKAARTLTGSAGSALDATRRAYVTYFYSIDAAWAGRSAAELQYLARVLADAPELLAEAARQLDRAEATIDGALKPFGFDPGAELRRPIAFDAAGNPSDVVFALDGRAGRWLPILEGDAAGAPVRYRITNEAAGLSIQATASPAPGMEGLKWTVNDNLFNHSSSPALAGAIPGRDLRPELYDMNEEGGRGSLVNIWHPDVRAATASRYRAFGRANRQFPEILFYDHLTWEPEAQIYTRKGPSTPFGFSIESGRSPEAIRAFQDWLTRKFGTIDALNRAWTTNYPAFIAVQPPPDPFLVMRRQATPLAYEHEVFRRESIADFIAIAVKALKETDPGRPVAHEWHGMMNYANESAFDNHMLITRVPAEMIEMHKNNFWPSIPTTVFHATVVPAYGKIPVQNEFIWNWGRRRPPAGEPETYRQGLQSIWRNCAYGIRTLTAFAWDAWPAYNNAYMDILVTRGWDGRQGEILREAAASLPVGFRRGRRFGDVLRTTRLAPREVVVLQPSTAAINAYPYYCIGLSFSVHTIEARIFHDLLFNRNVQYGYALEESLFDGKANLADWPAVVLPYAVHFPAGLTDKLLAYVRNGGTLICSGVPGQYDAYGRPDGRLVREVFGDLDVAYTGNDYIWQYALTPRQLKPDVRIPVGPATSPLLLDATYGKGRMLISAIPFGHRAGSERLVPFFQAAIDQALDGQRACTLYDRFELVLRTDGKRDYLAVMNYDLGNAFEDRVVLKGEYARAYDLGIGPRFAVPLAGHAVRETLKMPYDSGIQYIDDHVPAGSTGFWLKLEPGEGTIIALER